MQVGQVDNNHFVNRSDDSSKMAQHVVHSEENKAMVKENNTNIIFELGAMKVQMHKQDRTEFQKLLTNSDTETFSQLQQSMIDEKNEHNSNMADMSTAQKKINNLFGKNTTPRQNINLLA